MDESGAHRGHHRAERNVAHRIIEEFMLLANETVADYLDAEGGPGAVPRARGARSAEGGAVRGVHRRVRSVARRAARTRCRPRHFQKLVEQIQGKPVEKPVAFLMLKTMQKARYAPENLGHFGLAAASYTHFTSPIRRYPDLVVHRLLRARRHGRLDEARREEIEEDLPEIARHTSERERRADDAERELLAWRKVRFMADKVGDEFDGYVTGVAAFGLFVELVDHFVEGLVHISSMADDYYRFLEAQPHAARREHAEGLPAGRQSAGAGHPRGPGAAPDRSGADRDPRCHPGRRAPARAATQQGAAEEGSAERRSKQRPGRRERGDEESGEASVRRSAGARWPACAVWHAVTDVIHLALGTSRVALSRSHAHRRRHRRPHRSREERARPAR